MKYSKDQMIQFIHAYMLYDFSIEELESKSEKELWGIIECSDNVQDIAWWMGQEIPNFDR